jgi:hypothetical protein
MVEREFTEYQSAAVWTLELGGKILMEDLSRRTSRVNAFQCEMEDEGRGGRNVRVEGRLTGSFYFERGRGSWYKLHALELVESLCEELLPLVKVQG